MITTKDLYKEAYQTIWKKTPKWKQQCILEEEPRFVDDFCRLVIETAEARENILTDISESIVDNSFENRMKEFNDITRK